MEYYSKYLKYKNKYSSLKNLNMSVVNPIYNIIGGSIKNVAIAVFVGKKILLVRDSKTGELMLPGGKIDDRERAWTAVKREWEEETGISFPVLKMAHIVREPYNYNGHTLIWYAKSNKGESSYGWNKNKKLKEGETTEIVFLSFSELIKPGNKYRLKSYVFNSLKDMYNKKIVTFF